MQLQQSTWQEVEAYLAGSSGIIVPIGSTEQHGPNGLIGTDAICPETVARGVGEETATLVAPTLSIGMSQHHMAFPGSMTLKPSTLLLVIVEVVESLARHGFDRIYFLNGHGGNIATLGAAINEVYASGLEAADRPLRLRQRNWWSGEKVRKLQQKLYGRADGAHATASEVALSWFAHPDSVKDVEMSPKIAPMGPIRDAEDFRRSFPDGRMGSDPSLASVEAGSDLYDAAVGDVRRDFEAFVG
ncbi:MAG: creatininase family protein [Acidobacteriota bacterium]|nr:creatininase family protein [Acidobacteriota bacterium]